MHAVAILRAGMVTPVGLTAPASCAAMRGAIDAFSETRFMFDGAWLIGAEVPFTEGFRGREKLLQMVVPAIRECLGNLEASALRRVPLLLCLPEADRPGRLPGLDESMLPEIEGRLQVKFGPQSAILPEGRMGGVKAIERAGQLVAAGAPACVVAGVDTLLVGPTLDSHHRAGRLLTEDNSNGFIPGEAAAAVLVGPPEAHAHRIICRGVGYGTEPAPVMSEEPLRADGLRAAILDAFRDASMTWADIDYRITDANGEQYWFKEAALAMARTMRVRKAEVAFWHPADCIGDIGAAIVPCVLGVALAAETKCYAPGPGVLCHFSRDGSERGALALQGSMSDPAD
jgi:3-oxoacyl-[acyl-carrier-protein] synthase I